MTSSNAMEGEAGNITVAPAVPIGPAATTVTSNLPVDGEMVRIDARIQFHRTASAAPQKYANRPTGLPPTASYRPVASSTTTVAGVPSENTADVGAITYVAAGARPARKWIRVALDPE